MGRIQDFFGKILRKGNAPQALPEGMPEVTFTEKRTAFVEGMNVTVNDRNESDIKSEDENIIEYNPQNFLRHPDWREWYSKQEIRNEYYDNHKPMHNERTTQYQGALTILPISKAVNRIVCTCIDEERKTYQLELGKTKGNCYYAVMQEIDAILALQINRPFFDEKLEEEINRHYGELKKIKDFEISGFGEQLLTFAEEGTLELISIDEDKLYDKKIDFMNLPTKQTVSQMQVECIQADTKNQSLEQIDERVEAFYEYCEMAIDIGIFGRNDWKRIDDSYIWDNSEDKSKTRNIKYNRNPSFKRESYTSIREKYLTEEQTKKLKGTMVSTAISKGKEGYIGNPDVEELSIRGVVSDAMAKLPLRMEEYILAYQVMHQSDPQYTSKIQLLNDMVNYSKRKFLEARGIILNKTEQKEDISLDEVI